MLQFSQQTIAYPTPSINWLAIDQIEPTLERITRLTARQTDAPFAVIVLNDDTKVYYLAPYGFQPPLTEYSRMPPLQSPSEHRLIVLSDLQSIPEHLRPLVTINIPNVRFFASAPILDPAGVCYGALCILDDKTRPDLNQNEQELLIDMAAMTLSQITLQQQAAQVDRAHDAHQQSAALLKQSEAILSAMFHSNLQAVILVDKLGMIQAWNKNATRFVHQVWQSTLQIGDSFYDYLPTENTQYLQRALEGNNIRVEHQFRSINSIIYWFELEYTAVFNERGYVTGLCISLVDVTERHQATDALKQRERFFHALVRASSDLVILLDKRSVIRYVSFSIQRITGRSPTAMIGQYAFEHVHPDDCERVKATLAATIQKPGIGVPVEFRYLHANGSWIYLEAIGNNLLHDPNIGYIVTNARDVTERHRIREQLLLLESAVQNLTEAIVITDAQLDFPGPHIVYANAGFEMMTGYRADEVQGNTTRILQGRRTDPEMLRKMRETLQQGLPFYGETINYRKDGTELTIEWSVEPVSNERGEITHFVSVQRDISARRRSEQLSEDHRQILEMVVQNSSITQILKRTVELIEHQQRNIWAAVLLFDEHRFISTIARTGTLPPVLSRATHLDSLMSCPRVAQACIQHEKIILDTNELACPLGQRPHRQCSFCPTCVIPILSGQGEVRGVYLSGYSAHQTPTRADQELLNMVSRLTVIVLEQRQLVERLEHHAYHDLLTQLPNRLLFEKRLRDSIDQDDTTRRSLTALLFIDLDRFKQVNDTLGHHVGDRVLSLVAQRMLHCIPANATLARLGGDEFACILPHLHDSQQATEVAQHLLLLLREPFPVEDHQIFLTANVGISIFPLDGTDSLTLQRNADIALYRSKRRGVSGLQYFTPDLDITLRESLLEIVSLEEELYRSSIFDEFTLYYQPQIDFRTGTIVGVEALLRWDHPTLGMVDPGKFIPVAEQTGLIRPIGSWVLRQACRQMALWRRYGYSLSFVAVNVSAEQFADPSFVRIVAQTLQENELPAKALELELTETLMFSDFEHTARHLAELKELGVNIALDDFGTTPATLSGLRWLPIDSLKIDKSFANDLKQPPEESRSTIDLIQTIVKMAHNLQISTTLEGIEMQYQSDVAHQLECDRGQGFWFGRPLPAAQCDELLYKRHIIIKP